MSRKGFRLRADRYSTRYTGRYIPPHPFAVARFVLVSAYAADVLDTERVWALRDQGLSLREVAAALSTSLAAVQRALARRPPPEPADADPDDKELARLLAGDIADPDVLTPPFTYHGIDDGAVRWRDANGIVFGQVDLWRWGERIHSIVPGDYETNDEYMAAWRSAETEIEAATAHARAGARSAGVVWDDARHRWVQRRQPSHLC